ncbi:MAG: ribosome small subunit-dependent GTPase A [Candidatus Krumholzibacteriia bacterium]
MKSDHAQGLVLRVTGHEVWVDVGGNTVVCLLRGRFRRKDRNLQVVAGDRVEVYTKGSAGGPAPIEAVLPRQSWLSRYVGGRHGAERVIVANIEVLIVVVSVRSPRLHYQFLDRVLVSAERGQTEVTICLNKIDKLDSPRQAEDFVRLYEALGYPVIQSSARTGAGIDQIRALLRGGVYAFVGQSGVGKSSILNRIDPMLDLKVGYVARKTGRGRHTTSYSQLFRMEGGFVADTPGMQTFGFPGTEEGELSECFPEFRGFEAECRFRPCTHSHEPECAVKSALEKGFIEPSRYASYEGMLSEIGARKKRRR